MINRAHIPMTPSAAQGRLQAPAHFERPQRWRSCGGSGEYSGGKTRKDLQRIAARNASHATAPPAIHEVLRSAGRPLDTQTPAFMQPCFGHDFGKVRIHTDARTIHAPAGTVGHDIVFRRDEKSDAAQQHGADQVSGVIMRGTTHPRLSVASPTLQRDPNPQPAPVSPSTPSSPTQIARDGVVKALKLINPGQDETTNIVPYDGNNAEVKDSAKININGWSVGTSRHATAYQKEVPGYSDLQVKIYFKDTERKGLTTIGLEHSGLGHVWDYVFHYSPIMKNPANHTNADIAAQFCAKVQGGCP